MHLSLYILKKFFKKYKSIYNSISPLLQYPGLEPVLDDLLPKKSPLIVAKWFVILLLLITSQFFHDNCGIRYI